jgi:class 3 adenylate cyclase
MHPLFQRALEAPLQAELLVALCDWRLFFQYSRGRDSAELFQALNAFYLLTDDAIEAANGWVLKFMGDAALMIFPADLADAGVMALLGLKRDVDGWMKGRGIDSWLHVNAHFGEVTLGRMGRAGLLDAIGETVNLTATLGSKDFALSQQAFRRLTPEHRRLFHKFSPPILYLPAKIEI